MLKMRRDITRIAIVTMHAKQGKREENVSCMKQVIQKAREEQADMIVFPQNTVSGYLLGDQWLDDDWCRYVDSFNEALLAESEDIATVWGNIHYRNRRRFNTVFFTYRRQTHMRVKRNTPYMDGARYFEENPTNSATEFKEHVFALNFGREVQLTDVNISLDAAMYELDHTYSLKGNVIYAGALGTQNSGKDVVVMAGGSGVRMQKKIIYQAAWLYEGMQIVNLAETREVGSTQPQLLDALLLGIRDFDTQIFNRTIPWIVDMSGRLDSSVAAALLVAALRPKRVYGYNMTTRHNSTTTISNAAAEAKALGIVYQEGDMETPVQASAELFHKEYGYAVEAMPSLVTENVQTRSRGYLLSGSADILGGAVVNNGNRVETALGYCTLYGDSIKALSLIGDLIKVQLLDLSKALNAHFGREVAPLNLLPCVHEYGMDWTVPLSVELKDAQFDPMKWLYHDYLIEHLGTDLSLRSFMENYTDGGIWKQDIARWMKHYHLDDPDTFLKDLGWLLTTRAKTAFKRLQLPPLLSVHKRTLANTGEAQMREDRYVFEELKQRVLND